MRHRPLADCSIWWIPRFSIFCWTTAIVITTSWRKIFFTIPRCYSSIMERVSRILTSITSIFWRPFTSAACKCGIRIQNETRNALVIVEWWFICLLGFIRLRGIGCGWWAAALSVSHWDVYSPMKLRWLMFFRLRLKIIWVPWIGDYSQFMQSLNIVWNRRNTHPMSY